MDTISSRNSRQLVFADDGSPPSDASWAWLTSHDWSGWRLTILTVRKTLVPGGPVIDDADFVPRVPPREAGFIEVAHLGVDGDPRTVLLGHAEAGLLVVGCHHRGHLAGILAGSTTEWLLVRPPAPLVIARHGHRTRSVACFIDGSVHAQHALEIFRAMPWASEAEVALVSIDDGRTDVEDALSAARAVFPGRRPPAELRLTGKPKRVIPEAVRTHGFDLAVLGTRGLTGLARMTAGSSVSSLVKDGSANLLIAYVDEPVAASSS